MAIPVPVGVETLSTEMQEIVRYLCRQIDTSERTTVEQTVNQTTGEQFVDRGDPASVDFDETDLTLDSTWRTLDLSSIIPSDATLVLLRGYIVDTVATDDLYFREPGNSNSANVARLRAGANFNAVNDMLVMSSGQEIEYNGASGASPSIELVVGGWWA